jgi:hypothetical protein
MSVPNIGNRIVVANPTALASTQNLSTFTSVDAFGRSRVSEVYTLFDSQQRYVLDYGFTSNVMNGGSISYISSQSSANLCVTTTSNSFAARETNYVMSYQPGKSLLIMASFVMAPQQNALVQRVGYFGTDNGFYLELSDDLYFVRRSNSTGTVINTRISQSNWSGDKLNGFSVSGTMLDITTSQIFWCDMEWLGVGNVRCGLIINGSLITCHTFQHANSSKYAYTTTAVLPIRYEIKNTGTAPTSNLIQICSTAMSEGGYDQPGQVFSSYNSFSRNMTAGTWYPLMSIKLAPDRLDAVAVVSAIDIIVTSSDVLWYSLWSNVSLTNLIRQDGSTMNSSDFAAHYSDNNVYISSNAYTITTTGCYQLTAGLVTSTTKTSAAISRDLSKFKAQIGRNSFTQTSDIFVLAVRNSVTPPVGSPTTCQAVLSWAELL